MASEYDKFKKLHKLLYEITKATEDYKKLFANIDKEVKLGLPICMSLVMNHCESWISFYVANGADPNMQIGNGFAALHVAVILDKKDAVKILLQMGADVNLTIETGLTPLDIALEFKRNDMIAYLQTKEAKTGEDLAQELWQKAPISNDFLDMIVVENQDDKLSLEEKFLLLEGYEFDLNG